MTFTHTHKIETLEELDTVPIGGVILATSLYGNAPRVMQRSYASWYGIADTENYPNDEIGLPAWHIATPENDTYEDETETEE